MRSTSWKFVVAAGVAVALSGTGCATKKFVAQKLGPVEQRIGQNEDRIAKVEGKTQEQGKEIEGLESDLSRTKERVTDVDNNGKKNTERIGEVNTSASKAQQSAAEARMYAETRGNTIEKFIEGRDQFKLNKSQNVLFAWAKHDLDEEARAMLDEIAKDASARKRFILEVQGFTDSSGSTAVNFELSQRRAESVVRYLTMTHKIPLRSIHLIGSGSEAPVADNKTKEGRKQNRRVEVRLFTPELENSAALPSAQLR